MKYFFSIAGSILAFMLHTGLLYSQNRAFFEKSSLMGLDLNYEGYTLVDSSLNISKMHYRPTYQEFISKDSSFVIGVSLYKEMSLSPSKETGHSRKKIKSPKKSISDKDKVKVKKANSSQLKILGAS